MTANTEIPNIREEIRSRFSQPRLQRFSLRFACYFIAALVALIVLFPLYWTAVTSVKSPAEVYQVPPSFLPKTFSFENYINLLTDATFLRFFANSMTVAILTVFLVLLLSIPAGYSLGRLKYRGKSFFNRYIFIFYLFPGILLLVPLYLLISSLGLTDSLLALVFVYTTFGAPYATILITQFFRKIPKAVEESARIDGAPLWVIIWRIVVPMARPGIAVAAISTFIASWVEFLMASILTVSKANKTLPVGLYEWMGTYDINWGSLTAGAVIATLPILVLFIFMSKIFISGLMAGSIKG